LPNEDALQITPRCRRKTDTVDLLEHVLKSHYGRLGNVDRIGIDLHNVTSKKQRAQDHPCDPGLWVKNRWPLKKARIDAGGLAS
jgi:hypothetical protein